MPPVKEVSESVFEYLLSEVILIAKKNTTTSEEISVKLEQMGYQMGFKYIEKVLPLQKPLGTEPLDIMKFICKEFYEEIFRKKIDKLQTNHRGLFVLADHKFKWIEKYTFEDDNVKSEAGYILQFTCGILRGAFANLGLITIIYSAVYNNYKNIAHIVVQPLETISISLEQRALATTISISVNVEIRIRFKSLGAAAGFF